MLEELREQKKTLVSYLKNKVAVEDWHSVQDAASDIREVEAKIHVLILRDDEIKYPKRIQE